MIWTVFFFVLEEAISIVGLLRRQDTAALPPHVRYAPGTDHFGKLMSIHIIAFIR
jgi:hypothetical protein